VAERRKRLDFRDPHTMALQYWIDYRLPIFTFTNRELNEYPTPRNLSYWWNFGSLVGIMLVIMM
jgi:quinol-cytochrome oxidoreductase complex cytochrome b subunit